VKTGYNHTFRKFVPKDKDKPDITFLTFQHFVALDLNGFVSTFCEIWERERQCLKQVQ
jgi:hypothetical protein